MISQSLYYKSDNVYRTIISRIPSLGYNVTRFDVKKREIEVRKWFFPFIKRTFNIAIMETSDTICSFSVIENGNARPNNKHENQLQGLIAHFF
ncbi:hypothetical protein BH11BAC1_BH11BAC1_03880 [soil metagenome]